MLFHIPLHTSPGHTIYHTMSATLYHILRDARQAIACTMPLPSDHTFYHAVPSRPYHTSYLARQAIPYTMPCPPVHAIYYSKSNALPAKPNALPCHNHITWHARQAIPYTVPYRPGHTLPFDARKAILDPMPAPPPGLTIIPCDARKAILYTMRGPQGHTIHHAMPARLYHIP